MNPLGFLRECREAGLTLEVEGQNIRVRGPHDAFSDQIRQTIRLHKPAIVAAIVAASTSQATVVDYNDEKRLHERPQKSACSLFDSDHSTIESQTSCDEPSSSFSSSSLQRLQNKREGTPARENFNPGVEPETVGRGNYIPPKESSARKDFCSLCSLGNTETNTDEEITSRLQAQKCGLSCGLGRPDPAKCSLQRPTWQELSKLRWGNANPDEPGVVDHVECWRIIVARWPHARWKEWRDLTTKHLPVNPSVDLIHRTEWEIFTDMVAQDGL